ncbi:2-oxoglutarate dehydrogenase E1 component [Wolbachia endosymbiont of Howardula sp.]|uniref:2-oxoglutarate dehydrogenase E1 component n=1 Tax=Wolbachia endosymbiont of Howardula sp. TaxID=2916816 RepID=UPI00217D829B|nr:2-oxoglutarate dehydrogenase E1 component [Wolbachia endosymbiont of Howardula sp.]UWI83241.1 2-oxoglutarate dehydrogenase E1 component [Wolbachia endosymbiont of Howardula sp.]
MLNAQCINSDNIEFIEEMYARYLQNDHSIGDDWYQLFHTNLDILQEINRENDIKISEVHNTLHDTSSHVADLFRSYGHFFADLNPLKTNNQQEINFEKYSNLLISQVNTTMYRNIYCTNIGFEFMYITSYAERIWLQRKIEHQNNILNAQDQKEILKHIIESELFEQFLHIKFPGYKRFSLEGGESTIVAIEKIISDAAGIYDIEEIVFCMPHRGRLNVITKVIGKEYHAIFSEFQGALSYPSYLDISGDVKYHMGYSSDRILINGQKIHLSLCSNPSHLEAITPVLAGRIRAKQNTRSVLGVAIHGDAAFTGQGVVAETFTLSHLNGYNVNGIIHIIINNQIGFTANPCCTRSSFYCTDIAKSIEIPVFHVNGDKPESVSIVIGIAMEYRAKFKKDVIIDIICYRRHGHNEGDEPHFTQPMIYQLISKHQSLAESYAQFLISKHILNSQEINKLQSNFRAQLDKSFLHSKLYTAVKAECFEGHWSQLRKVKVHDLREYYTDSGVLPLKLQQLYLEMNNNIPKYFNIHAKVKKMLEERVKRVNSGMNIDWATAESLTFASLLTEGIPVRLSGQDSSRGTFSHRHAKIIDQVTEEVFIPLNNINNTQSYFEVIDSPLSEYAVMGFEYGYSIDSPYSLVMWEGQFGDFANGAQIIIDQFISSAETKWLRSSGLVLLLPHGYEGQGPEHSSAHLERFLQLCAESNLQVVNCSTPANYFHVLRRQIYRDFRSPLIILTPKSLLRHKQAVSNLSDFTGQFLTMISDSRAGLVSDHDIQIVILCSGKAYYDVLSSYSMRNDITIIRIEQLYPLPVDKISDELVRYKNAEIIWYQEEPQNMGGWIFINTLIEDILSNLDIHAKKLKYIGRPAAASPACGSFVIHANQQEQIIKQIIL